MSQHLLYEERLASGYTEALFIGLTLIFAGLSWWQINRAGSTFIIAILCILVVLFLFYSLNYRTLKISMDRHAFKLKFGVFSYAIPLDNIESFELDHLSWVRKYGGAGIHFMLIRGRYRVSFNFLEHPRIVIALRKKAGWVRDVSFSTRQPEEILRLLQEHTFTGEAY